MSPRQKTTDQPQEPAGCELSASAGSACRVCGYKTSVVFNIRFKATPICESCANAITMQQVSDLIRQNAKVRDGGTTTENKD